MTDAPSAVLLALRRLFARLLLLLSLLGVAGWLVVDLPAQGPNKKKPPVKEEEDDTSKKPSKERPKVEEEDDKKVPKKKVEDPDANPPRPGDADTLTLRDAYQQAKGTTRDFLYKLLEPHDEIVFKGSNRHVRVQPVDEYLGETPPDYRSEYKFKQYADGDWTEANAINLASNRLQAINYYEQIALTRVKEFLEKNAEEVKSNPKARLEVLQVAQVVLDAALAFHESALKANKRPGKAFEEMGNNLRKKRLEVVVQRFEVLVESGDWNSAFAAARRLAESNTRPEDRERIAKPLVQMLEKALGSDTVKADQLGELQRRLADLERLLPNSEAARPIQNKLKSLAQEHFNRAKRLLEGGTPGPEKRAEILVELRKAETIWPQLPGLHEERVTVENLYPTLRVGVRTLPEYLSPGMAFTDSEKLGVELIFEGLVKLSGYPLEGQRYTPGLAEGRPQVLPLGRQFQIAPGAAWAEGKLITANDVRFTLTLLKNPKWRGSLPAWRSLYDNVQTGGDPSRVNVLLNQGFIDPLSLMTFKIIPSQPWQGPALTAGDDLRFAQEPSGSGPYQYKGVVKTKDRSYASFVSNPLYAERPAKRRDGLLQIKEIHFVVSQDPVKDLQDNLIDLVADLPSGEVKKAEALRQVAVLPAQPTRRIWFLAVNHRRPNLQKENLRKAIAHAIPRDKLLNDFFRGDQGPKVHKVLTGPYPPGSWACDPTIATYTPAKAKVFFNQEPNLKDLSLKLACANDDPRVGAAMDALAQAVKGEIGLDLKVERMSPHELHVAVEETHSYDLAYYSYDFPSDAYWLWPLFDPEGTEPNQGNYLGYTDGKLSGALARMNGLRDIRELQRTARTVHGFIFEKMPLIPLWQLDRHVAFGTGVKPVPFDPLLVFGDVDQWRLEKK